MNSNNTSKKIIETQTDPLKKPAIICAYLIAQKENPATLFLQLKTECQVTLRTNFLHCTCSVSPGCFISQ